MPRLTPSRIATLLLAATYLVVGSLGDSLYYLVESPSVGRSSEAADSGSYAHSHGDGLWHHHQTAGRLDDANPDDRTIGDRVSVRHDHTCLLLALASAVELSLHAAPATLVAPELGQLSAAPLASAAASSFHATLGARGPPGSRAV